MGPSRRPGDLAMVEARLGRGRPASPSTPTSALDSHVENRLEPCRGPDPNASDPLRISGFPTWTGGVGASRPGREGFPRGPSHRWREEPLLSGSRPSPWRGDAGGDPSCLAHGRSGATGKRGGDLRRGTALSPFPRASGGCAEAGSGWGTAPSLRRAGATGDPRISGSPPSSPGTHGHRGRGPLHLVLGA